MQKILTHLRQNHILAYSIGIVYLWFGALKFFPEWSPAEDLAKNTVHDLCLGMIPMNLCILLLAILEVGIGLGLILNIYRRTIILAAIFHLLCTFIPLIIYPDLSFAKPPLGFTLVGQYIMKNIVLLAGLVTLYRMENK